MSTEPAVRPFLVLVPMDFDLGPLATLLGLAAREQGCVIKGLLLRQTDCLLLERVRPREQRPAGERAQLLQLPRR